jgi:PAS domain S-box-containing protein
MADRKEPPTVARARGAATSLGRSRPDSHALALSAATVRLAAETNDAEVPRVLVEQVAQTLGVGDARLVLLDSDPEWWVLRQAVGPAADRVGERGPRQAGLLGQVLQGAGAVRIADCRADAVAGSDPESAALGSVLGVPLRFKAALLGALVAARPPGEPAFTAADQATLTVLASLAAVRLGSNQQAAALRARAQEVAVMHPLWRPQPEEAGDFVVVTNRHRQFIDVDEAACRILGYSREVLLQLGVGDIIPLPPWADQVDTLQGVRDQLVRGIPITYDTTVRRRDGSLMPARMTLQMLPTPDGLVTRGTFHDLSMEKQAQLQALQAEKQRLLQEIGSGLAHELNTPLAILMGNVEMALEESEDPELHALLEPARDAAQRISGAVQSIQRFARPVLPGSWTSVDLSQLAAQVVDQTRPLWEAGPQAEGRPIHLYLETLPVAPVRGNPIELQEAIRELLANAVQALPHGGRIVVRADQDDSDGQTRLSVADNGVGMTEEVRQRCIEPFFTTRRPAASGLGLNRVHHTVLRHRGRLTIESTEAEGSRITLSLPRAPGDGEAEPAADEAGPTEAGNNQAAPAGPAP